ncbi:MAG: prepilin peptidase [Nostocoides sp.]
MAVQAGLLVAAGTLAGAVLNRWLSRRDYRYVDEQDLPVRSTTWVIPVLAVTLPLVWVGLARQGIPRAAVVTLAVIPLVALAAIDIDTRRLPDRITRPLTGYAVLGAGVLAVSGWSTRPLIGAALGGLGLGAFYLLLVLLGGASGMGLGDAKLAVPLGALLGLVSPSLTIVGTFLGFLLGSLYALYRVLLRGAGRKSTIPFGPFMVLGGLGPLVTRGVFTLLG